MEIQSLIISYLRKNGIIIEWPSLQKCYRKLEKIRNGSRIIPNENGFRKIPRPLQNLKIRSQIFHESFILQIRSHRKAIHRNEKHPWQRTHFQNVLILIKIEIIHRQKKICSFQKLKRWLLRRSRKIKKNFIQIMPLPKHPSLKNVARMAQRSLCSIKLLKM